MLATVFAKTFWWKGLLIFAGAYLGICLLVYVAQRRLIYFPSRYAHPLPEDFKAWRSPDGSEFWGYKKVTGAREALFFFHGNGGNASGWSHAVAEFPGDVFVLEYPGYGDRGGVPSEKSLKAAALAGFEAEHARYEKLVVAGQSLGTAITEVIFSRHPQKVSHLVLITPFTSIAEVARAQFPWLPTQWLLRDQMHLFDHWQKFPGKSCVVLAGRDEIIPRSHNLRYLQAKTGACEIVELPEESHNSIQLEESFWKKVLQR